jgi:mRNA interferase RelE/StbE
MEMKFSITLHPLVIAHDIPRLDSFWRQTIRDALRQKLGVAPDKYGKPLRQSLKGCWTLRVGDYRVIYKIAAATVYVVAIMHRSKGYSDVATRI